MRLVLVAALFVLVSFSFSNTSTQTDWSGGPDIQGPVSDWGDSFWNSDSIADYNAGELCLLHILIIPAEHTIDVNFDGAWSVYSADVDGDGDADVLGAGRYCNEITWWENTDGTGTVWAEHIVDGDFNQPLSVYSTDVDGDGDADVLGAGNYCDDITWWENIDGTGTVWSKHTIDGEFDAAWSVYSTDVDGDGDADVLGAGASCDDITWWENTVGTGTVWVEHTVDGNFDGAMSVYSTDVDGDGDADVLGAGYNGDNIIWWENTDGTGTVWAEHNVDVNFDGAMCVYSTDVDGDYDADILGAGYECDDITWWENIDGTGTVWAEHAIDGNFNGASSVYSTDVDGDGDADVLGAGFFCDDITWWENIDGTGTAWEEHTVDGDFDGARSIYTADLDGDGDADVLGAGFDCDDLTWWDVKGYSPTASLESSILNPGDVGEWEIFASNSQSPAATSVSFQFRSSNDSSNMGVWSDTLFSPYILLDGILADFTRYLQYKVILQTADPTISPELFDVTFSYSLVLETDASESSEVPSLSLIVSENPSRGFFSALLSVPETGLVELSIYDVSGRVVSEAVLTLPIGTHTVTFDGLAEGVYFCTMRAGEFSATERIIVLD